jgi:signal peptidase
VGQVLTIEAPIPGHPVVSHRVVAVENRTGTVVVRTKGDANPEPDHWVAQLGGTRAWRTVVVVPHVGRLMAALHRPAIHLVSSWLLPVWLLAEVLRFVWRRPRPARPGDVEDELDVGQNEPEPA